MMFSSAFFLPPQIVKRLQFILPPNTTRFGGFFRKMVRVVIQNFLKKPVISTVFKADE